MRLFHYRKFFIRYLLIVLLGIVFFFSSHVLTQASSEESLFYNLHLYYNFYDTASGDINETRGLYSQEIQAVHVGNYLQAKINEWPAIYDLSEVDGYPKVLINYGDVSGREVDITDVCQYDSDIGFIQIPIEYKDEYLTIKSVMSDSSMAYQDLVPDAYKVNKTTAPAKLRKPASDTAVFEVLSGSSNDAVAVSDISSYNIGDQIIVQSGYIQTLNRRQDPALYDQTGTSAYCGYEGEGIGYAITFDCGSHSAFSNIGASGVNGSSAFPTKNGTQTVNYSSRNWMYARCITDDSNYFDGNPMFTDGKIYITGKSADGTLTCWVELYASGPQGEAAQNVGMYFQLHPPVRKDHSLTIQKTIHTSDIWWTHGEPAFIFQISGRDTDGYTHHYQRTLIFTKEAVTKSTGANGTITLNTTLDNLPAGNYSIQELKVSRFALTDVTAQTDNISISKSNYGETYGSIQPIKVSVTADLTQKDGIVTFFNRKITWDKFSHNDMIINSFPVSIS